MNSARKESANFAFRKALKSLDESEYMQPVLSRQAEKKWHSLQSEKNIFVKKNKWQQYLLQKGFEQAMIKTWSFPEKKKPGPADGLNQLYVQSPDFPDTDRASLGG